MNKELGDPGKAGMPRNEEEKKEGRKVGGSVLDLRAVPGEVWWSCWESWASAAHRGSPPSSPHSQPILVCVLGPGAGSRGLGTAGGNMALVLI